MEEQARADQEYLDRYRAEQIRKARMDWLHPSHWSPIDNPTQPTQQSVAQQVQENVELNPSVDHVDDATASSAKKNDKTPMTVDMQVYEITPPPSKQQKDKAHPLPFRIHVKNRGRSERIANQKKLFKFDDKGTRSNPELAFDCSP